MTTTASSWRSAMNNIIDKTQAIYRNGQSKLAASVDVHDARTLKNPWKTSLWACFVPFDLCLVTTFCPCVTFGKTSHRLENDGNMTTYNSINPSCMIFCCLCTYVSPVHAVMQWMQLKEFRDRYNLEGNIATDSIKSCCCLCCSLCQTEKESKLRVGKQGMDGVVEDQYARLGAMVYGPERLEPITEEVIPDGLAVPASPPADHPPTYEPNDEEPGPSA